jgi:hypothetical protein
VRRTFALVAAVAAALALAAGAQAKNLSELKLCGPNGCAAITDRATIDKWEGSGDGMEIGTPALSPYYDLVLTVQAGEGEQFENGATSESWSQWYAADSGALRGESSPGHAAWSQLQPAARDVLATLAKRVDPYPAPEITSARVGRRVAADPASYSQLFDPTWKEFAWWPTSHWTRIRVASASPSPWTDGKSILLYSPKRRLLSRDGVVYRVPRAVARELTAARSLRRASGHVVEFAAVGVVAAALAATAAMRRRRGG